MKQSLPYVPWYHGDFLRSTLGWTLVEQAAYWKLLCAQWEIGPLPHDLGRLAAIIGLDPNAMTALWPALSKKFKDTAAGLVNERMEAHRQRCLEYRAKQSEGGRIGGIRSAQNRRDRTRGSAQVIPLHHPQGGSGNE